MRVWQRRTGRLFLHTGWTSVWVQTMQRHSLDSTCHMPHEVKSVCKGPLTEQRSSVDLGHSLLVRRRGSRPLLSPVAMAVRRWLVFFSTGARRWTQQTRWVGSYAPACHARPALVWLCMCMEDDPWARRLGPKLPWGSYARVQRSSADARCVSQGVSA